MKLSARFVFPLVPLLLLACGGAAQPGKAPAVGSKEGAAPTEPKQAAVSEAAPPASAAKPTEAQHAEQAASQTDDDPHRDGLRKASRPPAELITAPDVVFVFNFAGSEIGETSRSRCEEENGDDPQAVRQCLNEARTKVPVEFIQFAKDASGAWWWVTYNRYKGNLLKWHKVQFSPGPETEDSIVLNLLGKDKGIAPMPRVPRSLAIDLPNDYSIVVKHPEYGAMTYDAKIGLMQQN